MESKTFNPEHIKILGSQIILEHISSPIDFDSSLISYHGFHVDMELNINPEDDILKVDQRFDVVTESDGNNLEEVQAVFHLIYYIRVEETENYTVSREEDKIVLQTDL